MMGARFAPILFCVLACLGCQRSAANRVDQQVFDTPDAAAEALARSVIQHDTTALLAIMGVDARTMVLPTDRVQAAHERQIVAAALAERWWLEEEGDSIRTMVIGNEAWPFPIPIVREDGGWRFDTEAGREEIRFRRIGANETAVIELATAYVEAQREYASASRDGQARGAYAQQIASDPGKHNGLFWRPTGDDSTPSPMGELVARAAAEGYTRSDTGRTAYHGYYFKILKAQGPNAPGGARSWVAGGSMRGGFGLLAWPADYGSSGIMTFMVGPDGVLLQKDLGAESRTLAPAIDAFDPDGTWSRP